MVHTLICLLLRVSAYIDVEFNFIISYQGSFHIHNYFNQIELVCLWLFYNAAEYFFNPILCESKSQLQSQK